MKKIIVQDIHITDSEDDVPVPLHQLVRNFKSLQEWWAAVCNSASPLEPISFYELGVFESTKTRVFFLVGKYKSDSDKKIAFQPQNMYFLLPDEYSELSSEELDKKLIAQLVDLTKKESFSNCYLAQADSIVFRGNIVIWAKSH